MGKYFADVHASHESQFQNLPHGLADTDEIRACRAKPQTYENILELADALCWQLRFREAIDALTQAVKLEPERMEAYRKRGPKYLDTLQFERALADYTRCEQADGVSVMSRYRIGMAQYMLQNYDAATAAFAGSLAIVPQDDDMYIADVYWLVLSQLRAGKADEAQKTLQQHYRPDMYVGHHTAYEKAMRVAAGAIAKKYLAEKFGIEIRGCLTQMGDIPLEIKDWSLVEQNPFFCPDPDKIDALDELMRALKKEGDSIGAKVTVVASGVPAGLGEPVFDRLDADIAHALMSINAVKGVEIGDGFDVVALRGSQNRDEITKDGFQSNHAGGILGGISSGQQIIAHMALKPTSSITVPGRTINRFGEEVEMITKGRHDPCVGIRAVPIAEAMLAIVLMDHLLRQRAQNADVKTDIPRW